MQQRLYFKHKLKSFGFSELSTIKELPSALLGESGVEHSGLSGVNMVKTENKAGINRK